MHSATLFLALLAPLFASASPMPWDGAPAYSGASNSVNGGAVTGGGGINLIKILAHNGASAGASQTGDSEGGEGGDRFTNGLPAGLGIKRAATTAASAGGSGGGAAYTGGSGTAEGGGAQTDPELTLLDILSDSAAPGGYSGTGSALGGAAGLIS